MSVDVASAESIPDSAAAVRAPIALFVVIYTLAFAGTSLVHELAHAVTSALLGGKPVLYSSHVRQELTSGTPAAWVAAAGCLGSLVQGVLLAAVLPALARRSPAVQLLVVWGCLDGFVNFFGYLITTPFAGSGDLGDVAELLEWSSSGIWTAFALGVLGILAVGTLAAPLLLRFAPSAQAVGDPRARSRFIVEIGVIPWLLGGLIAALDAYPSTYWLPYAYPLISGCYLLGTRRHAARVPPPELPARPWPSTTWWPWALALGAVTAVFIFVLRPGVRVGW
jgi:hypothetical protein